MSILSDKEIIALNTPYTAWVHTEDTPGVCTATLSRLGEDELSMQLYTKDIVGYTPLGCQDEEYREPMIVPFVDHQVRYKENKNSTYPRDAGYNDLDTTEKIISFGLSSYGYDLRIANEFKIFTNTNSTCVDPKNFDPKSFVDFVGDVCIIPPNSFVLARSVEYFNMPNDVTALLACKSTYARTGLNCPSTVIEAGWCGNVTLEFANTSTLPVKLYANEGACQLLFFKGAVSPNVSYADRNGKYQGQTGITLPRP